MAYDFTKNTSNYLRYQNLNALSNRFAGNTFLTISVWFRTRSAAAGTNANRIFSASLSNSFTAIGLGVNSDGTVYAGFRSNVLDAFEKITSTRKVNIGGREWNHMLVAVAYGSSGVIQLFLDGEWDSDRDSVPFTGALTPGTTTTVYDCMGGPVVAATGPTVTTEQFDGQIGEFAVLGVNNGSSVNRAVLAKIAKRIWATKASIYSIVPGAASVGNGAYPQSRMIFAPTPPLVNGMAGRVSSTDVYATLTQGGTISQAYGHPPVQAGLHWRYRNRKSLILPTSGAGSQTISPSSVSSVESFGTASVTRGAVTAIITGISSSETFGNHVVSNGTISIVPSGITSGQAFGTPTIIRGVRIITPTGIASAQAFGNGTIVKGTLVISPNGIVSGESFGLPAITGGTPVVGGATLYVRGFASFGYRRNS